jgi:hypothetical protein
MKNDKENTYSALYTLLSLAFTAAVIMLPRAIRWCRSFGRKQVEPITKPKTDIDVKEKPTQEDPYRKVIAGLAAQVSQTDLPSSDKNDTSSIPPADEHSIPSPKTAGSRARSGTIVDTSRGDIRANRSDSTESESISSTGTVEMETHEPDADDSPTVTESSKGTCCDSSPEVEPSQDQIKFSAMHEQPLLSKAEMVRANREKNAGLEASK